MKTSVRRPSRRNLLSWLLFSGALAAAYGVLGLFIGRFLLPRPGESQWTYAARDREIPVGGTRRFTAPSGEVVNLTRRADRELVALSSVCPHLGCQVHWEAHRERFFCPCHNGVFDAEGVAVSGPPADAGQRLIEYPLRSELGLVFIALPERVVASSGASCANPYGPQKGNRT